MSDRAERTDVVIVGAGPIGLETAVALKQAGADYVQIDAGPIGATIGWWAPGTRAFSSPERLEIAGAPLESTDQSKATGERYLAYLRGVARGHALRVRTYERVTRAERTPDGFALVTRRSAHGVGGPAESGEPRPGDGSPAVFGPERRILARRIVLAIGDMHRARRLNIPGEDLPHVSHYLDDPHLYFGRRLLIVGGKNSAAEAALRAYRCGARVTISYRGERFDPRRVKYWLRPELEWLIDRQRIGWRPRTVPREIAPDAVQLVPVPEVGGDASGPTPGHDRIEADHVLLLTGYVQDPALFEQLGLERSGPTGAPRLERETMESSVPGVYVAGTAVAGTQPRARIFIENSHVHVQRIVRAITGRGLSWPTDADYAALEES